MRITTFVQAVEGRGMAWTRSRKSIEESDIGTNYIRLVQPKDKTPESFFLWFLDQMHAADSELVLRLEDDAIVNRHILHNFSTWDDVEENDFGAGWGFVASRNRGRWNKPEIHGSVATLFKRSIIPQLIRGCNDWFAHDRRALPQDIAISRAVWAMGKRIYIHDPPIAEHPIDHASTLGHVHNYWAHTTQGRFELEWKRGS